MQYDFEKLEQYIDEGNVEAVKHIMKEYNLTIKDGRLYASDMKDAEYQESFWDQRQYVIKILLNSLYGTLLNKHCKFSQHDMGQSTTLTGRKVVFHTNSYVNELITGKYDYKGDAILYSDTDSCKKETIIKYTEDNIEHECTIEELFNKCSHGWNVNDKEYKSDSNKKTLTYNPETEEVFYSPFNYIYRHKTNKEKWEITSETGEKIIVTNDHSCMVEREGKLIEIKPSEMLDTDILIILDN